MRKSLLIITLITLLLLTNCTWVPVSTPEPAPEPQATAPAATDDSPTTSQPELPRITSAFAIEGKPFRFLGAFGLCPWPLKDVPWQEDLIVTAKQSGISVLHEMVPPFEMELGVYEKEGLRGLDLILDQASKHGTYVTIEVMQGWQIAHDEKNPYYHPGGMEGLIKDKRLKDAYKKRLEYIMMHRNTVNGRIYADDPTILAWVLIMEPIYPPLPPPSSPVTPPKVTALELRDWFQEMALYARRLDSNHLVSIGLTAGQASQDDWLVAFDVPALDFIYAEDADARILELHKGHGPDPYPLKLFSLGKPVVMQLSFTSGVWDLERIGKDYVWQASILRKEAKEYFEAGAAGIVVGTWGSALVKDMYRTWWSGSDLLFLYDITNEPIVTTFKELAAEFDTLAPILEP